MPFTLCGEGGGRGGQPGEHGGLQDSTPGGSSLHSPAPVGTALPEGVLRSLASHIIWSSFLQQAVLRTHAKVGGIAYKVAGEKGALLGGRNEGPPHEMLYLPSPISSL